MFNFWVHGCYAYYKNDTYSQTMQGFWILDFRLISAIKSGASHLILDFAQSCSCGSAAPLPSTLGTPLRVTLRTVATATLTPVAYGGKPFRQFLMGETPSERLPHYSAGFTATEWLDLSKLSKTD
ncbi:MAG: hypothetical protein HWQ23_03015 [Nostoc sp. JL33]|uniref:hypothetical protein n=1 Tax=Nostoc sp. JL33 TaxID=2815396 RepID=UPI0025E0C1CA|nr:hypothetical protein [Nostoc sp. JL33]MBN3869311.1 hypothetical protein [Nostoc sp. JL33]